MLLRETLATQGRCERSRGVCYHGSRVCDSIRRAVAGPGQYALDGTIMGRFWSLHVHSAMQSRRRCVLFLICYRMYYYLFCDKTRRPTARPDADRTDTGRKPRRRGARRRPDALHIRRRGTGPDPPRRDVPFGVHPPHGSQVQVGTELHATPTVDRSVTPIARGAAPAGPPGPVSMYPRSPRMVALRCQDSILARDILLYLHAHKISDSRPGGTNPSPLASGSVLATSRQPTATLPAAADKCTGQHSHP